MGKKQELNRAFIRPMEEGWRAGISMGDPRLCPYNSQSEEYKVWQRWHQCAVTYRTELENEKN